VKEAAVVAIIVLSVIVWLSIPLVLSRAMARRGFDGLSYLVVGLLFGPVAVVFAVMDVLFDVPEPARILQQGRTGPGDVSVLVVVGGESTSSPSTAALASFGRNLRRLGLAQVLPKGCAREDERRAERGLRQAAADAGHPELALLFGRPDSAVSEHAVARGYVVVITPRPDQLLSEMLRRSGRVHWSADDAPTLPAGAHPTPWPFAGTESQISCTTAPTRSARAV
jgi:hypothetical protein